MDDEARFMFDLEGYIIVPDLLSPAQLAALNATLDAHIEEHTAPSCKFYHFGDGRFTGVPSVSEYGAEVGSAGPGPLYWGREFLDVAASPSLLAVLQDIMGGGASAVASKQDVISNVRLDHDYLQVIRPGAGEDPRTSGVGVHGSPHGSRDGNSYFRYHPQTQQMQNGLVAVAIELGRVHTEDGGFGCIPGSHKSNYPVPPTLTQGGDGLPKCVRRVAAPPGAAIVFTESLLHTTLPWTGNNERRTLFLKYSPTAVSWSGEYYDVTDPVLKGYKLTEQEITLMEPPNARHGSRSWLSRL